MRWQKGEAGELVRHWFSVLRACGDDVREVLHDGHPTVCVEDAAFAYVDTFTSHVNVGFYRGADLPDPNGMLEGGGKSMRHVKIRRDQEFNAAALSHLIHAAYGDMKRRVLAEKASHSGSANCRPSSPTGART